MKIVLFLSFITATISGMFLFHVKHEVLELEREHQYTKLQCSRLQEDIASLHSHWCYLTRPERVETLLTQHWPHWVKLSPAQVMNWPTFVSVAVNEERSGF